MWRKDECLDTDSSAQREIYDLPLIQNWLNRQSIAKYLPFCPGFRGDHEHQAAAPEVNGHTGRRKMSNGEGGVGGKSAYRHETHL
jgi:hypothetical protein